MAQFPAVGVAATVEGINGFLRDMGKMDSAIGATADKADSSGSRIGKVGSQMASLGKAAGVAAVTGVVALGAAVVGVGAASLKMAVEWESAFAGVKKTVNTTNEELDQTEQGLRDLAKVTPVNVEDLAAIAELGGQLGVVDENTEDVSGTLLEFTSVIAAMGVSTNLTTEAAATGFAQIANVMGTTEKFGTAAFSRLGSSIVALGNSSATTESDILNFAQRIAGTSKVAGVTEADMLGISAAFTSVGIQAQAGGTAVSKTFLDMNKAALEGGEKMEIYAATAGLSAEEFGAAWEEDAGAVFGEFVTGLGMAGDDAVAILDALEIKDSQAVRAFLSLAGAGDLVTESMATANKGWDENTALATEAESRYKTTESQMILLKNTLKDVGITIGSALLPFFNKLLQAAVPLIDKLGKALPQLLNNVLIPAIEKFGSAFGLLIKQVQGFGIEALFTTFEDGSSIISGFFQRLGVGEKTAQKIAKVFQTVAKTVIQFSQAAISFAQQHGPAIRNAIIAIGAAFAAAAIISTIAGIVATIIALFNPLTLVIAAIALLAAAWTENWFGIRDVITEVINNNIIPAFMAIADFVVTTLIPTLIALGEFLISFLAPIVQEFATFIVNAFTAVRDWVIENWPAIQEAILIALTAIQEAVQSALSAVRAFWEENGAAIMAAVDQAWSSLQDIITAAITIIQGVIEAAMQAINGDWEAAWKTIQNAAKVAWGLIKDEVDTILNIIKDVIIPAALEAMKTLFSAAWTFIENTIKTAIENAKAIVNSGLKATRAIIDFILSSIKDKITAAWDAIPDLFKAGIEKAKNFITGAVSAFKAAGGAVVDAIKEGIDAAWDSLVSGLKGKLDDLADLLPFSEPKDPTSPLRGLKKSGMAIVGNILQGLDDAMPVLQAQLGMAISPQQQTAPVTTIGGSTTNISRDINIEVISNPASQPSERAIFNDISAALAASRT
jgi:TP901 family phage tail tape measure protein